MFLIVQLQAYLSKPILEQYKKIVCKFRLSSHCLAVETGRFKKVPLQRRTCPSCTTQIEDEFHLILICPINQELGIKFLKPYYYRRPSVFKLLQLFCSTNTKEICNLGKYLKQALCLRKNIL